MARDSVYRAREDRAAWKHWAKEARFKSETAEMVLNKASARLDTLHSQAKAVSWACLGRISPASSIERRPSSRLL